MPAQCNLLSLVSRAGRIKRKVCMNFAQTALDPLLGNTAWHHDWLWGCPLIVATVTIHVLGLGFISQRAVVIFGNTTTKYRHRRASFVWIMGLTTLSATALHGVESYVWAVTYYLLGALPDMKTATLYSLGAITTYGHTNLALEGRWQLMGAIEALNGWLLFGLSSAFLFWLIQEVSPSSRVDG
jgi:hypothetical protein